MRKIILVAAMLCTTTPALAGDDDLIWASAAMRLSGEYCGIKFTTEQQFMVALMSGLSTDAGTLGTLVGLKELEIRNHLESDTDKVAQFCSIIAKSAAGLMGK